MPSYSPAAHDAKVEAAKPLSLAEIEKTLQEALDRKRFWKRDFFEPYVKQQLFCDMGGTKRERGLFAGNQQGKSETGAFEMACHLTGEYPDWWLGRRFDHPITAWAAGQTSLLTRDVSQKKLCGSPGVEADFGTGYIPLARFVDKPTLSRGVTDAYDTIQVEHRTNGAVDGVSILRFKSYEQGRLKFQGETLDVIWLDEECPEDIYLEVLARITATAGMVYVTFTPLLGMTPLVCRYLEEADSDRWSVTMTMKDALHLTEAMREQILKQYPAHQRAARLNGIPMLGSGRIFDIPEEAVIEPALSYIPPHWTKLWSIDFGIGHPFAAVLMVWDKDNDILHIVHCIRLADQLPLQHAYAMKGIGAAVPVAWPQDGTAREKTSGETLAASYKKQGLVMLPDHATWPDGGISTEAGILEMQDRFATGRLKVASHLSEWLEEFRMYHRKDGLIVKEKDDLMSATRIGVMDKRKGRLVALGGHYNPNKRREQIAQGVDFDPFEC